MESQVRSVTVVAIIEAHTVTGPAKNLIQFGRRAGIPEDGPNIARVSIATFLRRGAGQDREGLANDFTRAVGEARIELDVLTERFRFDPAVFPQLSEILSRRSPDIVQTHGVKSHFLMRLSGLHRKYRWLAFHHGYTAENLKMRVYNCLDRWSLRGAERVVTVCRPFADTMARRGVCRERILVLPNSIEEPPPVPETQVKDLRRRLGILPGERVVLCVGRFSAEKGQMDLVRAGVHLSRVYPDMAFRIVLLGDGPQRQRVERASGAAGLSQRLLFAGHQGNVWPYYSLADLLVLPSHSEGSPNVLLEAMSAGVPIAATRVGGVPETVEDEKSALLAPAGEPEALARTMGRLLMDAGLARRLAANGRAVVGQRHSPGAYRRALMGIYEDVLRKRPPISEV